MSIAILIEKYPGLKDGYQHDLPKGWVVLVDKLLEDLQKVENWKPDYVTQIKEKFGGLRFYYDVRGDDGVAYGFDQKAVDQLVSLAENESSVICEVCGKTGRAFNFRVFCSDHAGE